MSPESYQPIQLKIQKLSVKKFDYTPQAVASTTPVALYKLDISKQEFNQEAQDKHAQPKKFKQQQHGGKYVRESALMNSRNSHALQGFT